MKGLGERIKYFRTEKGYTQPQLAKLIGVSNAVVSFWENDVNEPKASYIKALAACFSISTDTLLGVDEENSITPSE